MKLPTKVLAYGLALALEGTVAYATSLPAQADLSLDGINTEVQNQGQRITGLEGRTTNNEQAITVLNTQAGITTGAATPGDNTSPTTVNVPVTTATATPAPTPMKTITAVETIQKPVPNIAGFTNSYYHYTYDDGSTADVIIGVDANHVPVPSLTIGTQVPAS